MSDEIAGRIYGCPATWSRDRGWRVLPSCRWCGLTFEALINVPPPVACSTLCAERLADARRRDRIGQDVDLDPDGDFLR